MLRKIFFNTLGHTSNSWSGNTVKAIHDRGEKCIVGSDDVKSYGNVLDDLCYFTEEAMEGQTFKNCLTLFFSGVESDQFKDAIKNLRSRFLIREEGPPRFYHNIGDDYFQSTSVILAKIKQNPGKIFFTNACTDLKENFTWAVVYNKEDGTFFLCAVGVLIQETQESEEKIPFVLKMGENDVFEILKIDWHRRWNDLNLGNFLNLLPEGLFSALLAGATNLTEEEKKCHQSYLTMVIEESMQRKIGSYFFSKISASASEFFDYAGDSLGEYKSAQDLFYPKLQKSSDNTIRQFNAACMVYFFRSRFEGIPNVIQDNGASKGANPTYGSSLIQSLEQSEENLSKKNVSAIVKLRIFFFVKRISLLKSCIAEEKGNIFEIRRLLEQEIQYVDKYLRKFIPADADESARAEFETKIYGWLQEEFLKYDAEYHSSSEEITEIKSPEGIEMQVFPPRDKKNMCDGKVRHRDDLVAQFSIFRKQFIGAEELDGKIDCLIEAMAAPSNGEEFVPVEAMQRIGLFRELGGFLPINICEEIAAVQDIKVLTERMKKYITLGEYVASVFRVCLRSVKIRSVKGFPLDVQMKNVFHTLQLHIEIYYNHIASLRVAKFNSEFGDQVPRHPENPQLDLGMRIPELDERDHVTSENDRETRRQLLQVQQTLRRSTPRQFNPAGIPDEFSNFIWDNITGKSESKYGSLQSELVNLQAACAVSVKEIDDNVQHIVFDGTDKCKKTQEAIRILRLSALVFMECFPNFSEKQIADLLIPRKDGGRSYVITECDIISGALTRLNNYSANRREENFKNVISAITDAISDRYAKKYDSKILTEIGKTFTYPTEVEGLEGELQDFTWVKCQEQDRDKRDNWEEILSYANHFARFMIPFVGIANNRQRIEGETALNGSSSEDAEPGNNQIEFAGINRDEPSYKLFCSGTTTAEGMFGCPDMKLMANAVGSLQSLSSTGRGTSEFLRRKISTSNEEIFPDTERANKHNVEPVDIDRCETAFSEGQSALERVDVGENPEKRNETLLALKDFSAEERLSTKRIILRPFPGANLREIFSVIKTCIDDFGVPPSTNESDIPERRVGGGFGIPPTEGDLDTSKKEARKESVYHQLMALRMNGVSFGISLEDPPDEREALRLIADCEVFALETILGKTLAPVSVAFSAKNLTVTINEKSAIASGQLLTFLSENLFQIANAMRGNETVCKAVQGAAMKILHKFHREVFGIPTTVTKAEFRFLLEAHLYFLNCIFVLNKNFFMENHELCGSTLSTMMLLNPKNSTDPISFSDDLTSAALMDFVNQFADCFQNLSPEDSREVSDFQRRALSIAHYLTSLATDFPSPGNSEGLSKFKLHVKTKLISIKNIEGALLNFYRKDTPKGLFLFEDNSLFVDLVNGASECVLFSTGEITAKQLGDELRHRFYIYPFLLATTFLLEKSHTSDKGFNDVFITPLNGPHKGKRLKLVDRELLVDNEGFSFPTSINENTDVLSNYFRANYFVMRNYENNKIKIYDRQGVLTYTGLIEKETKIEKVRKIKKNKQGNFMRDSNRRIIYDGNETEDKITTTEKLAKLTEVSSGATIKFLTLNEVPFLNESLMCTKKWESISKEICVLIKTSSDGKRNIELPAILIDGKPLQLEEKKKKTEGTNEEKTIFVSVENPQLRLYVRGEVSRILKILQENNSNVNFFAPSGPLLFLGPLECTNLENIKFTLLVLHSSPTNIGMPMPRCSILVNCWDCSNCGLDPDSVSQTFPQHIPQNLDWLFRQNDRVRYFTFSGFSIDWKPGIFGQPAEYQIKSTDPIDTSLQVLEMIIRSFYLRDYDGVLRWLETMPRIAPFRKTENKDGINCLRSRLYRFLYTLLEKGSIEDMGKNGYWALNAIEKNLLLKLYIQWISMDYHFTIDLQGIQYSDSNRFIEEAKFRLTDAEKSILSGSHESNICNRRKCFEIFTNLVDRTSSAVQQLQITFENPGVADVEISDGEKEILSQTKSDFDKIEVLTSCVGELKVPGKLSEIEEKFASIGSSESSSVVKRSFQYYSRELRESREKIKQENALIPEDFLADYSNIARTAETSNKWIKEEKRKIKENLQNLVSHLTVLPTNMTVESWAERFLLQCRMMTLKTKERHFTCVFSDGSKLRFYTKEEFKLLTDLSTQLLLCSSLIIKNNSIIANQKKLANLQEKFTPILSGPNSSSPEYLSVLAQIRFALLVTFREVQSQQLIYREDGNYGASSSLGELSQFARGEILAFEAITGRRLTPHQTSLLKRLFEGGVNAFQCAMGGGKSSMFAPFLAYYITLTKKTPVVTPHNSQMESVRGSLGFEFPQSFHRPIVEISFSRKKCQNVEFLGRVRKRLFDARRNGCLVIVGSNDIAKLRLSYIELLNGEGMSAQNATSRFMLQREVLHFLNNECIGLTDEAHLVLKPQEEVNYPLGRKLPPRQTVVDGTMLLAKAIAGIRRPDGTSLFNLGANTQDRLDPLQIAQDFKLLGRELLKTKLGMTDGDPTIDEWLRAHKIPSEIFVQCLSGECAEKPDPVTKLLLRAKEQIDFEEKKEVYERMAVIFGTCTSLLPSMLRKTANHGYGFRVQEFSQKVDRPSFIGSRKKVMAKKLAVVPYVGAGIPSPNDFASEEVKACALLQLALCKDSSIFLVQRNGSDLLLKMFIDAYVDVIEQEKRALTKNPKTECPVDKLFRKIFGRRWGYSDIENVLKSHNERGAENCPEYAKMLDEIRNHLLANDAARLLLFEKVFPEFLNFRPGRITSTAADRSRYFSRSFAFTGTPNSEETWTPDLRGEHLQLELAVEGHILFKFCQDLENKRSTFTNVAAEDFGVESVLERGLQNKDQKADFRVLLDPSGLFKTIDNEEVARRTLLWASREKIGLQSVVYFYKFGDREGGEFRVLRPYDRSTVSVNEDTLLVSNAIPNLKPETLSGIGIDPNLCGYFLDQMHTVGTDPVLPPTAAGVLVSDLFNAPMSSITQAIMRLRQFHSAQTVSMVILTDKDESIKLEDVFAAFVRNHGENLRQQILKSLKDRIDNLLKDLILKNLPKLQEENGPQSLKEIRSVFSLFKDFFISNASDDPLANYISHNEAAKGEEIVRRFYEYKIAAFKNCCNAIKDGALKGIFEGALEELSVDGGAFAILLEDAKSLLDGENFQSAVASRSMDAEMDNDRNTEAEQQVQAEQQVAQQAERQVDVERLVMNLETPKSDSHMEFTTRNEEVVNATYVATSRNISHMETFHTIAVCSEKSGMAGISINASARVKALRHYGELMPDWLHVSENQRFASVRKNTPLLSPQCEVPSFLLIAKPEDENAHPNVVIITVQEAEILRKATQHQKQHFSVYSMEGNCLDGHDYFLPEEVANARFYTYIYYGDYYSLANAASQDWIEANICPFNNGIVSDKEFAFLRWFCLCAKLRGRPMEEARKFISSHFQRFHDDGIERHIVGEMKLFGMLTSAEKKAIVLRSSAGVSIAQSLQQESAHIPLRPEESEILTNGEILDGIPGDEIANHGTNHEDTAPEVNPNEETIEADSPPGDEPTHPPDPNEVLADATEDKTSEEVKTQSFTVKTWQKLAIGAVCVLLMVAIALCFWPISALFILGPFIYYLIIFSPAIVVAIVTTTSILVDKAKSRSEEI